MDVVNALRIFLVASAAIQVACATVFFDAIQARFVRPMLQAAESQGAAVPGFMRWFFTSRVPAAAMTAVPLALAWFIGTPTGRALIAQIAAGQPPTP